MPGKWRYVAGALLIATGVSCFVVFLVTRLSGFADHLERMTLPGEKVLTLESGSHTIYWEPPGVFASWPGIECSVRSKTGTLPLSSTWVTTRYSFGGRRGVSQFSFSVPERGEYTLAGGYPEGKSGPGVTLAVGPAAGWGLLVTVLGAIAIMGAGLGCGISLIVSTAIRRKRASTSSL